MKIELLDKNTRDVVSLSKVKQVTTDVDLVKYLIRFIDGRLEQYSKRVYDIDYVTEE